MLTNAFKEVFCAIAIYTIIERQNGESYVKENYEESH